MDRVNYRASDWDQVQEEQEEVLQELKELQNPEASLPLQSQPHVIGEHQELTRVEMSPRLSTRAWGTTAASCL